MWLLGQSKMLCVQTIVAPPIYRKCVDVDNCNGRRSTLFFGVDRRQSLLIVFQQQLSRLSLETIVTIVPIVSRDNRDVNPQVWDYFLITVKRNVIYFSSKFVLSSSNGPKNRFSSSFLENEIWSVLSRNFSPIHKFPQGFCQILGRHDVGSVSPSDQFPGILRWEVILITSRYPYDWEEINLGVSIISYFESIWVCGLNW